MGLKTVYEMRGDFPGIGDGRTLGIFETEEEALAAAKGCGSCDCGGDGIVFRRLAVEERGRFYLLSELSYELGVAEESEAKKLHSG